MSADEPGTITHWECWHNECFKLAHSLEHVLFMGWVHSKEDHANYLACIRFCITWIEDEDDDLPRLPEYDERWVEDQLTDIDSVPKGEISCLEYGIFEAIFIIRWMKAIFTLTDEDDAILDPVEKHLLSLVPWVNWID